jgi:type IV secretory pathway protease TraF
LGGRLLEQRRGGLGRARGYLRPGLCEGGVQPVIKPVVAVAGDVVDLGPAAVIVNGLSTTRQWVDGRR